MVFEQCSLIGGYLWTILQRDLLAMLQNSAEARGKFDLISGFCDAWCVQEVWLWFQSEFVLSKVIMQRTAGCNMRWSSITWRKIVLQIISMHMDVNEAEGAEGGQGG